LGVHLRLLSLLENPAVIVAAAASGDIPTLKDYLSKHPRDVRTCTCTNTDNINVHSGVTARFLVSRIYTTCDYGLPRMLFGVYLTAKLQLCTLMN
jgi:hypothetical protein